MKLGIAYSAFDGLELLKYAIKSIRSEVDFVAVIYQEIGYHGNQIDSIDRLELDRLGNLADKIICYKNDLNLHPQQNEQDIRNFGVALSETEGCTHHITADVDEFYTAEELAYVKNQIGDANSSVVKSINYFKKPTWKVVPEQDQDVSLIIKSSVRYDRFSKYPYNMEITKKPNIVENIKTFNREEFVVHHMSYIRRNMSKKMKNNLNNRFYKLDKFLPDFDKYTLGDRLRIVPDFLNRRTQEVPNLFDIGEDAWEQHQ